jgi:hypothetical protein
MHKHEQTGAYKCIEKIKNAFKNVQQMFIQQAVYIYHYTY